LPSELGAGFAAEKSSRSGYTGHDITMPLLGVDRKVERSIQLRALSQATICGHTRA
jgi:hypothetical protein